MKKFLVLLMSSIVLVGCSDKVNNAINFAEENQDKGKELLNETIELVNKAEDVVDDVSV